MTDSVEEIKTRAYNKEKINEKNKRKRNAKKYNSQIPIITENSSEEVSKKRKTNKKKDDQLEDERTSKNGVNTFIRDEKRIINMIFNKNEGVNVQDGDELNKFKGLHALSPLAGLNENDNLEKIPLHEKDREKIIIRDLVEEYLKEEREMDEYNCIISSVEQRKTFPYFEDTSFSSSSNGKCTFKNNDSSYLFDNSIKKNRKTNDNENNINNVYMNKDTNNIYNEYIPKNNYENVDNPNINQHFISEDDLTNRDYRDTKKNDISEEYFSSDNDGVEKIENSNSNDLNYKTKNNYEQKTTEKIAQDINNNTNKTFEEKIEYYIKNPKIKLTDEECSFIFDNIPPPCYICKAELGSMEIDTNSSKLLEIGRNNPNFSSPITLASIIYSERMLLEKIFSENSQKFIHWSRLQLYRHYKGLCGNTSPSIINQNNLVDMLKLNDIVKNNILLKKGDNIIIDKSVASIYTKIADNILHVINKTQISKNREIKKITSIPKNDNAMKFNSICFNNTKQNKINYKPLVSNRNNMFESTKRNDQKNTTNLYSNNNKSHSQILKNINLKNNENNIFYDC